MTARTRTGDSLEPPTGPNHGCGHAPANTDLVVRLNALCVAAGEADVLATVTVEWFDNGDWAAADPLQVERLAHLLALIAKAATAVVAAVDRVQGTLADAQPADSGDRWDHKEGK